MEIVITGYGLNEGRTIKAKLERVISGYRISSKDLERIRES